MVLELLQGLCPFCVTQVGGGADRLSSGCEMRIPWRLGLLRRTAAPNSSAFTFGEAGSVWPLHVCSRNGSIQK